MFFDDKVSRSSQHTTVLPLSTTAAGPSSERQDDDGRERKRKRTPRACDMCRLKKVRCEGGQPSRRACINCVINKFDCTYLQMARNELRDKAYVQGMETRLARMEQLVRKLCPEVDLSQDILDIPATSSSHTGSPSSIGLPATPPRLPTTDTASSETEEGSSDEAEADSRQALADQLQSVSLGPHELPHYFGKSSSYSLIQTAMDYKDDGDGPRLPRPANHSADRTPFWEPYSWDQRPTGSRYDFTFPDSDLIPELVDIYFRQVNVFSPLLHRQTLEEGIASKLHLRDEGFGALLLLVCACGARLSNNPRVLPSPPGQYSLAGEQWFQQVKNTMQVMCDDAPRLYDLQVTTLAAQYIRGSSNPGSKLWMLHGHGIRMALVLGAHRRKAYSTMPPIPRELLKRAFWILLISDRDLCYFLGRPCTMQDEDFDTDYLVECDDEYWITPDPAMAFKQPEGKPSYMAYFNARIRLSQMQSYALRTIYSISKNKIQMEQLGPNWEERTVMELDSALNSWADSLPEQLRWNPKEENFRFLTQAAALHTDFHSLQIVVHRPFISLRRQRTATFPSLTICTNAARSVIRIVDIQYRRAMAENGTKLPTIGTVFVAGLMLVLSIWGAKRSGSTANISKDLAQVHQAIYMLLVLEPVWAASGRAGSLLCEMLRAGGLPVPDHSASPYEGQRSDESIFTRPGTRPSTTSEVFTRTAQPRAYSANSHVPAPTMAYGAVANSTFVPSSSSNPALHGNDLGRSAMPIFAAPPAPHAPLAAANPPTWDQPAPRQAGPSIANHQPSTQPVAVDDFMRTLAELSGRDLTFEGVRPTMSAAPFGWSAGSGDDWTGAGGLQWEDWGNYFAAFGVPPQGATGGR